MFLIASCGKNGSTPTGGSDTEGIDPVEVSNCKIKFQARDSLIETAKKSNQARVECKLSEEAVIMLVSTQN
jgi:hypothetical protein